MRTWRETKQGKEKTCKCGSSMKIKLSITFFFFEIMIQSVEDQVI